MDSSVPMSMDELEEVVQEVAHHLYAIWAEQGRFSEDEITQYAQYAVEDTVVVINAYMSKVNEIMSTRARREQLINPAQSGLFDVSRSYVSDFE